MSTDWVLARSDWPRDQAAYIFLGNAVEWVGRSLFGEEWTGDELFTRPLLALPDFELAAGEQARHFRVIAHEVLSAAEPSYEPDPCSRWLPPSLNRGTPPTRLVDYRFSSGEWEKAQAIRTQQIEDIRPAVIRLAAVRSAITTAATAGTLRTGLRQKNDFSVFALKSEVWSAIQLHNVFAFFQLNPARPVNIASWGPEFAWVFVSREDLTREFPLGERVQGVVGNQTSAASLHKAPDRGPVRVSDPAQIESRYRQRARELEASGHHSSEEDDLEFLKDLNPSINRERMRKLRRAFAPAAWKRSGGGKRKLSREIVGENIAPKA